MAHTPHPDFVPEGQQTAGASTTMNQTHPVALRRAQVIPALVLAAPLAIGWTLFNQSGRTALQPGDRLGEVGTWLVIALALLLARRLRGGLAWTVAVLVSGAMALMRTAGAHFTPRGSLPFRHFGGLAIVELVVDWLVLCLVCAAVLAWLLSGRADPSRGSTAVTARGSARARWLRWGASVVVLLACWSPWLAVYYPGILIRDSWSSIRQGLGEFPLTNHHPVLFNLWIGACFDLAGATAQHATIGVLVFSLSQAVLFAAGLGLVVVWLGERFGRWPALAGLALFALDPAVAMWSITMQKDTLFALWATLLVVLLAETSRRGLRWLAGGPRLAALATLLVFVSFSRNNGPYLAVAVVGLLVLLALAEGIAALVRRRRRRQNPQTSAPSLWRLPLAGLAVLALVFGVQGPGYRAAGIAPSNFVESAGLPLNQIGFAVRYGHLTAGQTAVVEEMMPVQLFKDRYRVTIVDSIKFSKEFDTDWLNDHPKEFLGLWWSMLPANAGGYAKAWYGLAGGYLDPGRILHRMDAGTKRGAGPVVVDQRDQLGVALGIEDAPTKLSRVATQVAIAPGVNLAYSLPLVFWLSMLGAAAALLRRRPLGVLPHLPVITLVATLMIASPLTDFRYVGLLHLALPVILAVLCCGRATRPAPRSAPGVG